jgi:tetratricopeptide (TPR) repeat protein
MKVIKIVVFSIFFLINMRTTKAQQGYHILPDKATTDIVKAALHHTYNFEFDESKKLCEQIRKKYPTHPGADFMMALNTYWEMFAKDTYKEQTSAFIDYLVKAQELSKKMLEKNNKDIEGVFFKLAAECYLALHYSERNDMSNTLGYAKRLYSSMKTAFQLKTQLDEFYFPTGIYNYYVVQYPETHPIFKPFMFLFMSGSKDQAFKDMDYAWKNAVFSKTECAFHLCNIYLKYEDTPLEAYEYSKTLYEKYPKNLFFAVRHVEVLMARKEYKEAEKISNMLSKSGKKYFIATAYVFYGELYEKYFKEHETALRFYQKALQTFQESDNPEVDYLSFAYAGLGRYYKQAGNKEKATEYYKKCKEIAEYTSVIKEVNAFFSKK